MVLTLKAVTPASTPSKAPSPAPATPPLAVQPAAKPPIPPGLDFARDACSRRRSGRHGTALPSRRCHRRRQRQRQRQRQRRPRPRRRQFHSRRPRSPPLRSLRRRLRSSRQRKPRPRRRSPAHRRSRLASIRHRRPRSTFELESCAAGQPGGGHHPDRAGYGRRDLEHQLHFRHRDLHCRGAAGRLGRGISRGGHPRRQRGRHASREVPGLDTRPTRN